MVNQPGNSYILLRKQLYNSPDTVMSYRIQLYQPLMHLFCKLISRLGSNPTTPLLSKVDRGAEFLNIFTSIMSHIYLVCFNLKMLHNIYHMSLRACRKPSALVIGWYNAPGRSCHIGPDILLCHPWSHMWIMYYVHL